MNSEERNQLIDALLNDDISEADFLRLEAELHIDPEARRAYYEQLELNTLLQVEAENLDVAPATPAEDKVVPFAPRTGMPLAAVGIAAALALLLPLGFLFINSDNDPAITKRPNAEPSAAGYAVLTNHADAVWKNDLKLTEGDLLPQGDLQLASGLIQVELFSGVTVILEGEADFTVHSPMEMSVRRGKLRARVPEPAKGFRIHTADGELVDLGTEFGLDVADGHSEVHVLEGEVEWYPGADAKHHLSEGKAVRSGNGEGTIEMPARPGAFIGASELEQHRDATRASRRSQWLNDSRELRRDARLLAYYPFDQPGHWKRTLFDESGNARDGAIVAAGRATDRFGQKEAALDFGPTGSRVRVNVPGEHEAITLLCWTKIDSLDRWYNSLFLTDGHELNEPHWQIMDDGRLFFSVKKQDATQRGKDKHVVFSPSFWAPALSGKWVQLAVTYDGSSGTVTHYLNGEPFHQEILPEEYRVETVKIGPASIGNWSQPMRNDPEFSVRNLNGSIDEFAIFNTALTPDEIASLYEKGKP
ncbi:MAG: LamG-like jellyroll fold domain-containing protein [Verrucomicrobiota bacterium]